MVQLVTSHSPYETQMQGITVLACIARVQHLWYMVHNTACNHYELLHVHLMGNYRHFIDCYNVTKISLILTWICYLIVRKSFKHQLQFMVTFWNKHINNYISKTLAALRCLLLGKASSLVAAFGSESSTYTHPLCFLRTACFGASGVGGGVTSSGIAEEHVGVWTVFFWFIGHWNEWSCWWFFTRCKWSF